MDSLLRQLARLCTVVLSNPACAVTAIANRAHPVNFPKYSLKKTLLVYRLLW